jgi:hypothetical protein
MRRYNTVSVISPILLCVVVAQSFYSPPCKGGWGDFQKHQIHRYIVSGNENFMLCD